MQLELLDWAIIGGYFLVAQTDGRSDVDFCRELAQECGVVCTPMSVFYRGSHRPRTPTAACALFSLRRVHGVCATGESVAAEYTAAGYRACWHSGRPHGTAVLHHGSHTEPALPTAWVHSSH